MTSPWEDGILDDWIPSREPGWRPGLAFSGGVDSVASMLLMPQDTVLVYNRRDGFKSGINHTNADRLFYTCLRRLGRPVLQVPSNHESFENSKESPLVSVPIMHVPSKLFFSPIICISIRLQQVCHSRTRSCSTVTVIETLGHHGSGDTHSEIFKKHRLSIYQPVAGCSEVINQLIVAENGLLDFAQSCLRSDKPGVPCGACWKCFRKNTLAGHEFKFSNERRVQIDTFLQKRPLNTGGRRARRSIQFRNSSRQSSIFKVLV